MALDKGLVWITGASSGIGWATALHLARNGYRVAASARSRERLQKLAEREKAIHAYPFDVTDPLEREDTYARLREDLGPVDVLVNNAGYGLRGAVEDLPAHKLRDIFDVNTFAPLALTKLVLPEMRARRAGRIVMVSSVSGRVAPPLNGAYAATKFALEALSDSLRVEMQPWSVNVVLVEPGPIRTRFGAVAQDVSTRLLENTKSPYLEQYRKFVDSPPWRAEQYWTSASVANTILKAINADRPRARYPVHPVAVALPLLQAILPSRVRDRLMGQHYGF